MRCALLTKRSVPAVVVFGSREAKDTEKLLGTLDQNMKEGKADYIFVDTDRLDPNSELVQVARRSEEKGKDWARMEKPIWLSQVSIR